VTHHVSYSEAGPVTERSKAYVGSGIGAAVIAEGYEVLPLEARY
jgi:hypothetical protein